MLFRSGGVNYTDIMYYDGSTTQFITSTTLPPADTWTCIELYLKSAAAGGGIIKCWQNGVLIIDQSGLNTHTTQWQNIIIGATSTGGVTDAVLFDDIDLDTSKYIGLGRRIQEGTAIGSNAD